MTSFGRLEIYTNQDEELVFTIGDEVAVLTESLKEALFEFLKVEIGE